MYLEASGFPMGNTEQPAWSLARDHTSVKSHASGWKRFVSGVCGVCKPRLPSLLHSGRAAPGEVKQWAEIIIRSLARRRFLSLEAIRESLNTACPHSHRVITPAERHPSDTEHLRCPKCQKKFVPEAPESPIRTGWSWTLPEYSYRVCLGLPAGRTTLSVCGRVNASTFVGLRSEPSQCTPKWRCGPVTRPVAPLNPRGCPLRTFWPSLTCIFERCI